MGYHQAIVFHIWKKILWDRHKHQRKAQELEMLPLSYVRATAEASKMVRWLPVHHHSMSFVVNQTNNSLSDTLNLSQLLEQTAWKNCCNALNKYVFRFLMNCLLVVVLLLINAPNTICWLRYIGYLPNKQFIK